MKRLVLFAVIALVCASTTFAQNDVKTQQGKKKHQQIEKFQSQDYRQSAVSLPNLMQQIVALQRQINDLQEQNKKLQKEVNFCREEGRQNDNMSHGLTIVIIIMVLLIVSCLHKIKRFQDTTEQAKTVEEVAKASNAMERIMEHIREHKCIYIIICSLFGLSPIIVYVVKFRHLSISDSPGDWGVFGDYVGGLYGGIFTCIISILTIYLARALTKKDKRQIEISEAAKKLYDQICIIDGNNYNLNSITKFSREIQKNSLYVADEGLIEQLKQLYDQFLQQNEGKGNVDLNLQNYVLSELKKLYAQ